jgi:CubicO group peptidase (beta-lactamase class C family)
MPAILLGLLLLLTTVAARAQVAPPCGAPATTDDGWPVAAPVDAGFDPATLCGIDPRFLAWTAANIHSVLVVRHGKLVYEHYFSGDDRPLGHPPGIIRFDPGTMHDLLSITKSVTALVLGIELGRRRITGIDQPVLAQLPEYADLDSPEKAKITPRHLLTMSQGLTCNEDLPYSDPANSEIQMDYAPGPIRYILAQLVEGPPGTVYNYSGGSATIIATLYT